MTLVEGAAREDEPASTPLLADDRVAVLKAVREDGFALAQADARRVPKPARSARAASRQAPRALKGFRTS